MPSEILVTGAAGFVGFHICRRLLEQGERVVGIDNLNSYYDPVLKQARLDQLLPYPNFIFRRIDLTDEVETREVFALSHPRIVMHLAAQPGVRFSVDHPRTVVKANIVAFANVLEGCRDLDVEHLVFASSSSVYGGNTKVPFSVTDSVDHPISLYAATKKSNELMAHTYSHLFGIPTTGLRLFTVYGPWGRPDMATFLFTRSILDDVPIPVFNNGQMKRDFTYVDDIAEGVVRVMARPPASTVERESLGGVPYRIYNIGHSVPVDLLRFIEVLEQHLGKKARLQLLPMQPGDVPVTCADVSELERDFDFRPRVSIEEGLGHFVQWYRQYYGVRTSTGTVGAQTGY